MRVRWSEILLCSARIVVSEEDTAETLNFFLSKQTKTLLSESCPRARFWLYDLDREMHCISHSPVHRNPAGEAIVWMCSPEQDLVRSVAIHRLRPLGSRLFVPLIVRALDRELPHRQSEDEPDLEHGQLLPDAVARAVLKGAPGAFGGREQGVVLVDEPTLGEEVVGPRPAVRVAVDGDGV